MSSRNVVFFLPPKVHLLDITGPIHIFHEAIAHGAPFTLQFIGLGTHSTMRSSAGLSFAQVETYATCHWRADDLIFIPGMDFPTLTDPGFLGRCAPFFTWLRKQAEQEVTLCSVCTGAFLLGYAGLLRNRKTTTHWKYLETFKRTFPDSQLLRERLFVKDGPIYTSAGVSSGIDLALHLLEKYSGASFAAGIAKEVVLYLRRGTEDPQLSVFLQHRNHLNDRIHHIQDILATRIADRLTITELAAEVHISPRHLTRLFRNATGLSIGAYQRNLRRERARQMLREGYTRKATAWAIGLKSTNQLRALLTD